MNRIINVAFIILLAAGALHGLGSGEKIPPEGREVAAEGGSYRDTGPGGLDALLVKKDFLFINVHIPYEGEIANTDYFIPYNEIEENLSKLPDRQAKIILYCRSGSMSATAAKVLVKLGYTDVWNLYGGMIAWKNKGYTLADSRAK